MLINTQFNQAGVNGTILFVYAHVEVLQHLSPHAYNWIHP